MPTSKVDSFKIWGFRIRNRDQRSETVISDPETVINDTETGIQDPGSRKSDLEENTKM